MSKAKGTEAAPEIPDDDAVAFNPASVSVYGDVAKQLSVVQNAVLSITVAAGQLPDRTPVLVPYVDIECSGTFGREDTEMAPALLLSFENACFLMRRLCEDTDDAIATLIELSRGTLRADRERLLFAQANLTLGFKALERASSQLSVLIEG